MAKPSIGRAHVDTGHTFVWALALFTTMCGAFLMLLGGSRGVQAEDTDQESLKAVITELDAAANAIEDKDYGRTKAYLRSARKRLSRLDE